MAEPLLQFDLREELEQLRREDSWQRETGRSSKTLAKYPDFRIILVLMKAKTQMNEHRAEGRISIHHLLGRICIHLPDQKVNLEVGQLLVLDCGMVHNVEALEESAFLLTVSWPKAHRDPDAEMLSGSTEISSAAKNKLHGSQYAQHPESLTVCERTMTGVISPEYKPSYCQIWTKRQKVDLIGGGVTCLTMAPIDCMGLSADPGMPPRWTSSSKEGVGTAYSASSRVWFTISHGILNEIYFPTIDHPQTRDMQFLITDGESFFHEERRDLDSEIECIEADALGYRVTTSDRDHRYRLVKEIISDPHQSCVLVNTRLEGDPEFLKKLRIYALLAPHLEVGGYGNSARRFKTAGQNVLIAWKAGKFLAMGANVGFNKTSCGYVGHSDGWQDLHKDFQLDWEFDKAEDGNVAVIGEVNLTGGREFTVGIAFGDSLHGAVTALEQSLATPFAEHREKFVDQWHRACSRMKKLDGVSSDEGTLYRTSRNLLLAHEDKTFAGALIASASIPWGNAKGDEDMGGYHLVWTRDMVNSALALLACEDRRTPLRALVYLACCQQADGGFPQNFWIDGGSYWQGIQLDEVAFPILLAWHLWKKDALRDFDPYSMVRSAAALPCSARARHTAGEMGREQRIFPIYVGGQHCCSDLCCRFRRGEGEARRRELLAGLRGFS